MPLTKVSYSLIDGAPINVNDYGAVGDGVTDDTAAIQAAINACVTGGQIVGGLSQVYAVTSRLNISDKELNNIRFSFTSGNATMVVGGKARITNVTVSIGTTNRGALIPLAGVLNLHLATGVIIDNFEITDAGDPADDRIGIYCSTLASNTMIRNCRMNYIGWPILFYDDVTAYPNIRTVDEINYAGQSIGTNLFVNNCELGAADKTSRGDALEINTPISRYSNIKVDNCIVLKTVSSGPANGLGLGFADIDRLQITNNYIANCPVVAGAIHTETCTDVIISNNSIFNSASAIGVGEGGDDHVIVGNTIQTCTGGIRCAGSIAGKQVKNITISSNGFYETTQIALEFQNVQGAIISNNTFKNITSAVGGSAYMVFTQSSTLILSNINIEGNNFIKTNAINAPILGSVGTITELFSSKNQFIGIGGSAISAYIGSISTQGLSTDHYKNLGDTSGMVITLNTDPTGYVTGALGDIATDVLLGNTYRNDGTNWVLVVP
jgi:hypothetical protein